MAITIGGGIFIGGGIGVGDATSSAPTVIVSSYQVAGITYTSSGYPTRPLLLGGQQKQVVSADGSVIYSAGYSPGTSNDAGQQTVAKYTTTYGSATSNWAVVLPVNATAKNTYGNYIKGSVIGTDGNLWVTTGSWNNGPTPTPQGYVAKYSASTGDIVSSSVFGNTSVALNSINQKSNGNLVLGGASGANKNSIYEISTSSGFSTVSAVKWVRASVDANFNGGGFPVYGDAEATGNYTGGSTYFAAATTVNPTADKTPAGSQLAAGMFTGASNMSWAATISHPSKGLVIYNSYAACTPADASGNMYVTASGYENNRSAYIAKISGSGITWQHRYYLSSGAEDCTVNMMQLDGLGNMIVQMTRSAGGTRLISIKLSDRSINWQRSLVLNTSGVTTTPSVGISTAKTGVNSSSFYVISGQATVTASSNKIGWQLVLPSDGSIPNSGVLTAGSLTFAYTDPGADVVGASTTDLVYTSDTSNWSSVNLDTMTYSTPVSDAAATFATRANVGAVTISSMN